MIYAPDKFRNKLVVITGPSVSGKDAVANELIKWLPLKRVIHTTDRLPRPGERRGVDYHFVSRERFKELIKNDLLLEYNEFDGQYYGTLAKDLRRAVREGLVPLLRIDPLAALRIQRQHPGALVIFIKPESLQIIKKRLMERGDSLEHIERRLRLAKEAMEREPVFAYSIINRDGHLADTVLTVKQIVRRYLGL